MPLILAQKNRHITRDLTINDANGDAIAPGANDVVRVKIGRRGQTPILDLDSAANSANDSSVVKNTPSSGKNRVKITPADMNLFEPGYYTLELALYDNAEAAIKHVDHQVFAVSGTQGGDTESS